MAQSTIEEQVEQIARPIAGRIGLEVVDVEVKGEGPRMVLRIFVDGDRGVTVEECARVSESLSRQLDLYDLIPHTYTLEVSSPGLDREIKRDRDFDRFAGRRVELRTSGPVDGRRHFTGTLMGMAAGQVVVSVDGRMVRVPREQVAKARLVVDLEELKHDLTDARPDHPHRERLGHTEGGSSGQ